jgi:hypothetical protein
MWPTIEALDKILQIGFPKDDPLAIEQLSEGF